MKEKEVLKLAKEMMKKDPSLTEWILTKFPELAESEDERIRKALRERIIRYDPNNEILIKEEGISQRQFLAWLEKQGEQAEWSVEDKRNINELLYLVESNYLSSEEPHDRLINFLKSIKDRVQPHSPWKPSDKQMNALGIATNISNVPEKEYLELEKLYQDLKKLREE